MLAILDKTFVSKETLEEKKEFPSLWPKGWKIFWAKVVLVHKVLDEEEDKNRTFIWSHARDHHGSMLAPDGGAQDYKWWLRV